MVRKRRRRRKRRVEMGEKERRRGSKVTRERKVNENKYRRGTSDATTPSFFILQSFMMSFDDFSPSRTVIFVV